MACNGAKYLVPELEQTVYETLKAQLKPLCPNGILEPASVADCVSDYERQLAEMQGKKMELYEKYILGELDAARYKQEKSVIDEMILKIKNTSAAAAEQAKKAQAQRKAQTERQQIIQELTDADGLTQTLADLLIDRIYVYPENRIEIQYKFCDIYE